MLLGLELQLKSCEMPYLVMGMSATTFWDDRAGCKIFGDDARARRGGGVLRVVCHRSSAEHLQGQAHRIFLTLLPGGQRARAPVL